MMDQYDALPASADDAWEQAVLAIYDGIVMAEHILSGSGQAEVSYALLDDAAQRFGI